ncbi:MAG: hypothetical protein R2848_00145 [Thermomicrobiales bacterium]
MVSTEAFLGAGNPNDGMGFTPVDPPNAALVLDDGAVLVIELIDPAYDAAAGVVTYQVQVLDDVETDRSAVAAGGAFRRRRPARFFRGQSLHR